MTDDINKYLNLVKAEIRRYRVLRGFFVFLTAVLVAILSYVIVDRFIFLNYYQRIFLVWFLEVLLFIIFAGFILRPMLQQPESKKIAGLIESKYPGLKEQLLSAVELLGSKDAGLYSPALVSALILDTVSKLKNINLNLVVNRGALKRLQWVGAGLGMLFLTILAVSPSSFSDSIQKISDPSLSKVEVKVLPGDMILSRGSDVTIEAGFLPRAFGSPVLKWKVDAAQNWSEEKMLSRKVKGDLEADIYSFELKNLRSDLRYYVESPGVKSKTYSIKISDKLVVYGIELTYIYPWYSGLAVRREEDASGEITALAGTEVFIRAKSNRELESARIGFGNGASAPLKVSGRNFSGSLIVSQEGSYTLNIKDAFGNLNLDPAVHKIIPVSDAPPRVQIILPGVDIDLPSSRSLPLIVETSDDFGVKYLNLKSEILRKIGSYERKFTGSQGLIFEPTAEVTIKYYWDLSNVELMPGDEITYFIEAVDNNYFSGPGVAKTPVFKLKNPSLLERYENIEEQQKSVDEGLRDILEQQKQAQKSVEQVLKSMQEDKKMDWDEKAKLEEAAGKQKAIAEKAEDLAERLKNLSERLNESSLIGTDTLSQIQEIQQILNTLMTDKMKETLKGLQEALTQVNLSEQERALMAANFNQQEFIKRIEQTLELFKKIQLTQKLEALSKAAQAILKEQFEINKQTHALRRQVDKDKIKELADREQIIGGDLASLERQIKELAAETAETDPLLSSKLKNILQSIQDKKMLSAAAGIKNKLSQYDFEGATVSQQEFYQGLDKLSASLNDLRSQMANKFKQEISAAMAAVVQDALYVSLKQEDLINYSEHISQGQSEIPVYERKDSWGKILRNQMMLKDGLKKLFINVSSLSGKTFVLSPIIFRKLSDAQDSMAEVEHSLNKENLWMALNAEQQAFYNLNEVIILLMTAQDKVAQSAAGMGLEEYFERLKNMAAAQQRINDGTNMLGGPGYGMDFLKQLAYEQGMLSDSLGKLMQQISGQGDISDQLKEVPGQIGESREMLETQKVGRELKERQTQILRKLLDAQHSLKKDDKESEKRKAETAKKYEIVQTPDKITVKEHHLPQYVIEELDYFKRQGVAGGEYKEEIERYYQKLEEWR